MGAVVLALTAGTAAARPRPPDDYLEKPIEDPIERPIVIAGDPPPPPPPPAPPPKPKPDPRRGTVALVTGGMTYASDSMRPLREFGPGGSMGMVHLSHRAQPGFEALASATGAERGRSYAASVRMVVGAKLRRTDGIAPFMSLGAAFAVARLDEGGGKDAGAGIGLGPSGAVGLHGFLTPSIYWRASAGFVGAGIGTFTTDLGLGWVVGD